MQSLTSKDCAEETAELFSVEQKKYTADRWAKERVILEHFLRLKYCQSVLNPITGLPKPASLPSPKATSYGR